MSRKNIKNTVISILLISNAFYVIGCTNSIQPNNQNNNVQDISQQSNKKSLNFSKVTEAKYNELNSFMSRGLVPNPSGVSGLTSPSIAPSAYPSAAPTSTPYGSSDPITGSTSSGSGGISYYPSAYPTSVPVGNYGYYPGPIMPNYSPGYYGGPYFSGNFEDYVVSDFEEARTSGYTGSYLSVIKDIINPIIGGLATDTRLISSYGNTNKKGVTAQNPSPSPSPSTAPRATPAPPMPDPNYSPSPYSYSYTPYYQWQFTYVSTSKKEIYSILVSSNEVLVLKQKWKLRQLATNDLKIDSNQAIEIAEKAIKDKNYTSPNPYPKYYGNNMEYLYEIPEDASLSYTLSEENKGQMVWDINISMNVYSNEFYYNQGYVKIDAKTGDIISLNRIAKIKANYGYMSSTPYPYVSPSSTYIPEPYISPGITPFTSSSPTTAP